MPDLHEPTTSAAPLPNGNLEELQELLLRDERKRLDELEAHPRNLLVDATAVANVLPEAIRQRSSTKQDQHLEKSLERIIGKTFARAITESPGFIADAISPVMMPAIQRAIKTTVLGMMRAMDKSLSWRGITWHWEAWRTGKSFAEVALSHTMKYEVQRVFLFFKEDGIHLGDVHRSGIPPFEPGHEDLISSMFSSIKTAVQKFAQDEFQASENASMEEFKIGNDLTVLIEQGPKAVLAAVVRGVPPPSLRIALKDELDSIHFELNEALQNFRGDKKAFEAARPHLESCLNYKESDSSSEAGSVSGSPSPALMVLLLLLLSLLGWWVVTGYLDQQREADEQMRWAHFLEEAREKPGIQITHTQTADRKNGKTIVYGLRDPLSDEPQKIAQEVGLSAEAIDFRLEPYLSIAPELLKRRTRKRLDQLIQEIEAHHFDFDAGSSSLAAEFGVGLQRVLQKLREGDTLAQQLGGRLRVEIHGNTTEEGSAELNHRLARARAQGVMSALNVEQFQAIDILPIADSIEPSAIGETQDTKVQRARRVSFHIIVNNPGSTGPRP